MHVPFCCLLTQSAFGKSQNMLLVCKPVHHVCSFATPVWLCVCWYTGCQRDSTDECLLYHAQHTSASTDEVTRHVMYAGHLYPIPPQPLIQICFQDQQLSHSYHWVEHVSHRQVLIHLTYGLQPVCSSHLLLFPAPCLSKLSSIALIAVLC